MPNTRAVLKGLAGAHATMSRVADHAALREDPLRIISRRGRPSAREVAAARDGLVTARAWLGAHIPGSGLERTVEHAAREMTLATADLATGAAPWAGVMTGTVESARIAGVAARTHDVIRGIERSGGPDAVQSVVERAAAGGISMEPTSTRDGNAATVRRAASLIGVATSRASAREGLDVALGTRRALAEASGNLTALVPPIDGVVALDTAALAAARGSGVQLDDAMAAIHDMLRDLARGTATHEQGQQLGSFISAGEIGRGGDIDKLRSAAMIQYAHLSPGDSVRTARELLATSIRDWAGDGADNAKAAVVFAEASGILQSVLPSSAIESFMSAAGRAQDRGLHDLAVADAYEVLSFLDELLRGNVAAVPTVGGGGLAERIDNLATSFDELIAQLDDTSYRDHRPFEAQISAFRDDDLQPLADEFRAMGTTEGDVVADELDHAIREINKTLNNRAYASSIQYEALGEARAGVDTARALSVMVDDGSGELVDGATIMAADSVAVDVATASALLRHDLGALGLEPTAAVRQATQAANEIAEVIPDVPVPTVAAGDVIPSADSGTATGRIDIDDLLR